MRTTEERTFIAIDLKSFYASVECRERGLDPLDANLVVADPARTDKTICLAVSPSLKAYGIPGRARLFEVVQRAEEINARRRSRAPGRATRHTEAASLGSRPRGIAVWAPPSLCRRRPGARQSRSGRTIRAAQGGQRSQRRRRSGGKEERPPEAPPGARPREVGAP